MCGLKHFYFVYSFKERGARYALLMLNDEEKKMGVISASLGNHAQVYKIRLISLQIGYLQSFCRV